MAAMERGAQPESGGAAAGARRGRRGRSRRRPPSDAAARPAVPGVPPAPVRPGAGLAEPEEQIAASGRERRRGLAAAVSWRPASPTGRSEAQGKGSAPRSRGKSGAATAMEMTQLPPASAQLEEEGDEAPYEFSYVDYIFSNLNESAALIASSDDESHDSFPAGSCIFSCLYGCCAWAQLWRGTGNSSVQSEQSEL